MLMWIIVMGSSASTTGSTSAEYDHLEPRLLTRWAKDAVTIGSTKNDINNIKHDHQATSPVYLSEYPRPQLTRDSSTWKNLNGVWAFGIIDEDVGKLAPSTDSRPLLKKPLPHKIRVPYPVESALSGLAGKNISKVTEKSVMIYQRHFKLPRAWHYPRQPVRFFAHFGAIDWQARVFINDKLITEHKGGYSSFSADITDHLQLQKNAKQSIVVEVRDPTDKGSQPRGKQVQSPRKIWYTSVSGIWQTCWIEMVPKEIYVKNLLTVPDLDTQRVKLQFELEYFRDWQIALGGYGDRSITLQISIYQPGETRSSWKREDAALQFLSDEQDNVAGIYRPLVANIDISVIGINTWSPESPQLYTVSVRLIHNVLSRSNLSNVLDQSVVDNVGTYFGMRKISIDRSTDGHVSRIFLNNKPYFQMGLLDQGWWPDGLYTAPTDAALKYDIEITKKLGFNMIRKHVKVEPDRWYYWCDVLGILVWQDMPSGDVETLRYVGPDINKTAESKSQFYEEWGDIMHQLRNHPSIVMWVIFNEGWGQFDTEDVCRFTAQQESINSGVYTRGMGKWSDTMANQMSQSQAKLRLINAVSGWIDRGVGDVLDVHNYPLPVAPKDADPQRASVLGEYGGLGLYVARHSWLPQPKRSWSYKNIMDTASLTREFVDLLNKVKGHRDKAGLCAAIYTQTSDVEGEVNGIMTYDRDVVKLDVKSVSEAMVALTGEYSLSSL
jgi:beta-galactosidase/beta-glucuronidase